MGIINRHKRRMEGTNSTKKQHYIPQFYLKNFSEDNEHIFIYDRKKGQKGEVRYQTTIDVAHENHFYTYRTKQGTKNNLEDLFCKIEGDAASAINNVYAKHKITDEEIGQLAIFIGFLHTRVPTFKRETEEMSVKATEKIARMMLENTPKEKFKEFYIKKEGRVPTDKELDDIIDFGVNPKRSILKVTYPKEHWIKMMLNLGVEAGKHFSEMDWLFLFTKKTYAFITSDNPLLLVPPQVSDLFRGVGLLTPGAKKIIPLRPNMCLMMGDANKRPTIKFGEARKVFIQQLNRYQMVNCERFCFSPEKGKLERLVKKTKPYNIPKFERIIVE